MTTRDSVCGGGGGGGRGGKGGGQSLRVAFLKRPTSEETWASIPRIPDDYKHFGGEEEGETEFRSIIIAIAFSVATDTTQRLRLSGHRSRYNGDTSSSSVAHLVDSLLGEKNANKQLN